MSSATTIGLPLPAGVDLAKETVISGRVVDGSGHTIGGASVRLLDSSAEFTAEVMTLLESAPASGEIIVERCKPLRFAAENGQVAAIFAQLAAQHG